MVSSERDLDRKFIYSLLYCDAYAMGVWFESVGCPATNELMSLFLFLYFYFWFVFELLLARQQPEPS